MPTQPADGTLLARPPGARCRTYGRCSKHWYGKPARHLVLASIVFRLVRALLPLAMLWVSKLIIDGVVAWNTRGSGNLAGIWKAGGCWNWRSAIGSDVLGRANTLCDSLARRPLHEPGQRAPDGARSATRIWRRSKIRYFYDKLDRARRQTTGRMGLLAALLNIGQDAVTLASLSTGLIVFSPG